MHVELFTTQLRIEIGKATSAELLWLEMVMDKFHEFLLSVEYDSPDKDIAEVLIALVLAYETDGVLPCLSISLMNFFTALGDL